MLNDTIVNYMAQEGITVEEALRALQRDVGSQLGFSIPLDLAGTMLKRIENQEGDHPVFTLAWLNGACGVPDDRLKPIKHDAEVTKNCKIFARVLRAWANALEEDE